MTNQERLIKQAERVLEMLKQGEIQDLDADGRWGKAHVDYRLIGNMINYPDVYRVKPTKTVKGKGLKPEDVKLGMHVISIDKSFTGIVTGINHEAVVVANHVLPMARFIEIYTKL